MPDLSRARARMVERQIAQGGIEDERLLEAMRTVPREVFLPGHLREFAYEDSALPIDGGQTISQPRVVAAMIEAAEIGPKDRVLEIGAGSGYASAVLSRIASRVYAIERIEALAHSAIERLQVLGYDNIEIRVGDGSGGWPEKAPFDVIIVSAGGPQIPRTLREQLATGGRLVMPVGNERRMQSLVKLTRTGRASFHQEDLGDVMFVPLIGAHGWAEEPVSGRARRARIHQPTSPDLIRAAAEHLPDIATPKFGAMFDRFANARVVMLGEASHGTAEFYRARAAITRRLIERHGFSIVAVEADWPDAAVINRYVRRQPARPNAEPPFRRFPTWMWRNVEVDAFVQWLRTWNEGKPAQKQAGFYGLDLYNLSASIEAVLGYLDRVDPAAAAIARERYGCLMPWAKEPQAYGRMALTRGYEQCEQDVVNMLSDMLSEQLRYSEADGDDFFDALSNARLVQSAESYYRAMYYGAAESWNQRDRHMYETLDALLGWQGPDAKAVVWAHNSHIGDASKTEMGQVREELNIGQLARERLGDQAVLIGFGTNTGTVTCASDWDGPTEVKAVRPALPDSYESLAHASGVDRFLLDLRAGVHPELRSRLLEPKLQRFIGVIYRPETERWSHYSHCTMPQQFDAYVWFDETTAVGALPTRMRKGADDTYPFGL
jgi:protein-L-isoaspartate(D-aspartate) O-methyltransferase